MDQESRRCERDGRCTPSVEELTTAQDVPGKEGPLMNLDYLQSELSKAGWRDVQRRAHMGIEFDLVGYRRFTLTKWSVLVKALPVLDEATAAHWAGQFQSMSRKSQSWIWGSCLLMCLLAEDVAPGVFEELPKGSLGRLLRLKGGGGNLFVADMRSREVHGTVPFLPYDSHKFSKSLKQILVRTVAM